MVLLGVWQEHQGDILKSVNKPRLLDLFCGAGGAAVGYHRVGFEVVGVDITPQPRYPFMFWLGDALRTLDGIGFDLGSFDAIHASPPCQFATDYKRAGNVKESPNLIPPTRELLEATGLPYVIENVEKARPELRDPLTICGSMFEPVMDIQRHRLFETNWLLDPPIWPCRHKSWAPDRFPGGASRRQAAKVEARTGRVIESASRYLCRRTVEIGTWDIPLDVQQEAMGIDWMTLEELSEAIPPAYTELIGTQLMARLKATVAA